MPGQARAGRGPAPTPVCACARVGGAQRLRQHAQQALLGCRLDRTVGLGNIGIEVLDRYEQIPGQDFVSIVIECEQRHVLGVDRAIVELIADDP